MLNAKANLIKCFLHFLSACEVYSKRITDRILNGEIADSMDFPWMVDYYLKNMQTLLFKLIIFFSTLLKVALGYLNEDYQVNFECTGTIISEYFILTTANCTVPSHRPVVVRVGKVRINTLNLI